MFFEDSHDQSLLQDIAQSIATLGEVEPIASRYCMQNAQSLTHEGCESVPEMKARRHERHPFFRKAKWDFFTGSSGLKSGYIMNLSKSGCLLKASEPVDHRRWIRLVIQDHQSNVSFAQVGRVVRRQDIMESFTLPGSLRGNVRGRDTKSSAPDEEEVSTTDITLYRYGVEFTHPGYLSAHEDLIFDLSSKNLTVRSCLNRNSTSSIRPGSLA